MEEHSLEKTSNGWKCKVCRLIWKARPRGKCVGIPSVGWNDNPQGTIWDIDLNRNNLKLKHNAKPVAYHRKQNSKSNYYCYTYDNCEKYDENVPDLIVSKQEKDELGYKTKNQLRQLSLKPTVNARTCAVYYWDKHEGDGFAIFYHPEDVEFQARDQLVTKTTLRKAYLLSPSWIRRLGEPDRTVENPHHKGFAPMQLYSTQRVENYLAQNSEEYAVWLDKRDKHLELFHLNKAKIFRNRNLIKEQTKQCIKCASGAVFGNDFLCAVHPLGLSVEKMPCQSFSEKRCDH